MNNNLAYIFTYYGDEITQMIVNKYDIQPLVAFRRFLFSETYQMLCDPELQMLDFSPIGIFDMWENEQITGNPRNSLYIRRD